MTGSSTAVCKPLFATRPRKLFDRVTTPVIPVAHNAGTYWPKNALLKRSGLITVSIGPLFRSEGQKPAALMQNIASWIENETRRLHAHETL